MAIYLANQDNFSKPRDIHKVHVGDNIVLPTRQAIVELQGNDKLVNSLFVEMYNKQSFTAKSSSQLSTFKASDVPTATIEENKVIRKFS